MCLVRLMWRSASESKPVHSCYSQLSQAWRMVEPIRIISAVSNWFRRRTSHELNSMNSFLAFSFFSTSCFFLSSSLCLYLSWARLMHEINSLLKSMAWIFPSSGATASFTCLMPFSDSGVKIVLSVPIACLLTDRLLSTSVLPWESISPALISFFRYGNISVPDRVFFWNTLAQ